jgi:hypothetical protein
VQKNNESIIHLNEGGKLQVPANISFKVAELYVDGIKKYDGIYTAGNAPEMISGEGSLIVGQVGLKVFIR